MVVSVAASGVVDCHRLLVRAVCDEGQQAVAAWRAWRALVDFDEVDEPSSRLLPLVARRPGLLGEEDDEIRGRIRGLYRRSWVRSQLLWQEATPVLHALAGRQVPVMLLKGAALRPFYDDDIGARPMYDIDILVPPEHARCALEVLVGCGWEPEHTQGPEGIAARLALRRHSTGFVRGENGRLDLHWHALATSIGPRADAAFWRAARPATDGGGRPELVMHPADLLLHVVVHGTTGANAPPIQWVVDALRIVDGSAEPLGGRLAAQARAHGVLGQVAEGLRVVEELTGSTRCHPILLAVAEARRRPLEGVLSAVARAGRADRVLGGLAKHAAGETGLRRGAADFVSSSLDLPLSRRPALTVAHALLGRPPSAARLARRFGPLSRVPAPTSPPLRAGAVLDFTDPAILDAYAGPGWQSTTDLGAQTRCDEARLVLPVGSRSGPALWAVLTLTTVQAVPVLIAVDERRRASVPGETGPVDVSVPLGPGVGGQPVEISLRAAGPAWRWPARVGLVLHCLRLTTSPDAP